MCVALHVRVRRYSLTANDGGNVSKRAGLLLKFDSDAPNSGPNSAGKMLLQYSPGRSGSTLLYQVLTQLGVNVHKTHECHYLDGKVVISYRHPCDIYCSFFRISRDLNGDDDLRAVMRQAMNPTVWWSMLRGMRYVRKGFWRLQKYLDSDMDTCLLRYALFKDNYDYLFDRLESFLQFPIDRATRDRIETKTSFAKNKAVSSAYDSFKEFDQKTLLHGKHLGSGAAGQWYYVCPYWMRRLLMHALAAEIDLYHRLAESHDALPKQRMLRHNAERQATPLRHTA